MKRKISAILVLLSLHTLLFSENLEWSNPSNGNLDSAGNWTPSQLPVSADRLYFSGEGSYTVGTLSGVSVTAVETRGSSGTVTFDLGSSSLSASASFVVRQNTEFLSGTYSAINLQTGLGVASKSILLDGSATVFNLSSAVDVGRTNGGAAGNSTQFTVSGGAQLAVGSTVTIGRNESAAAANNNTLTVSGAGSQMTADSILVGNLNNSTSGASASNNALEVNDGGSVTTGSLQIGRRTPGGTLTTLSGNRVIVGGSGAASSMTVTGIVSLGSVGTGNYIEVGNGGTFNAQGGQTTLNSRAGTSLRAHGGTYDATGQTILVYNQASLSINSGGIIHAGTVDLRGALDAVGEGQLITAALTSTETSAYNFTLNGLDDYTQVTVSGNALFHGTLNIVLGSGYNAVAGDSFQLFSFGESSGSFTSVVLQDLSGDLEWDISTLYSDGIIQVIPEPAFYTSLFAVIGFGILVYRRRLK